MRHLLAALLLVVALGARENVVLAQFVAPGTTSAAWAGLITAAGGQSAAQTALFGTFNVGSVIYSNGTTLAQDPTVFNWNDAGKLLIVSASATALTTPPAGTVVQLGGATAQGTRLLIDAFANGPGIAFRRADGSITSPSALAADDVIGSLAAFGYGSTGYSSGNRGGESIRASATWTDSDQGTYFRWDTTATGGTTTSEKMRLYGSGCLFLGTPTADCGAGNLYLASNIFVHGVTSAGAGQVVTNAFAGSTDVITGYGGTTYLFGMGRNAGNGLAVRAFDDITFYTNAGNNPNVGTLAATIDSSQTLNVVGGYKINGVAGANCAVTVPAHITVVNGLVTLCN